MSGIELPVELLTEIIDALPLAQYQRLKNEATLEWQQIPARIKRRCRLRGRKQLRKVLRKRTKGLSKLLREDATNQRKLRRIERRLANMGLTCRMMCGTDCNCRESYEPLWAEKYAICKQMHAFLSCWYWERKEEAGQTPSQDMLKRRQVCADYIEQYEKFLEKKQTKQ